MSENNGNGVTLYDKGDWLDRSWLFLEETRRFYGMSQAILGEVRNPMVRPILSQSNVAQAITEAQVLATLASAASNAAQYCLGVHQVAGEYKGIQVQDTITKIQLVKDEEEELTEIEE